MNEGEASEHHACGKARAPLQMALWATPSISHISPNVWWSSRLPSLVPARETHVLDHSLLLHPPSAVTQAWCCFPASGSCSCVPDVLPQLHCLSLHWWSCGALEPLQPLHSSTGVSALWGYPTLGSILPFESILPFWEHPSGSQQMAGSRGKEESLYREDVMGWWEGMPH